MLNPDSVPEGPQLTIVPRDGYLRPPLMPACPHPSARTARLFAAQDFITNQPFDVVQCAACGLAVTFPQPSAHELARYYPPAYYGALTGQRFPKVVESLQDALYAHRVRRVERLNADYPGRVLDIGCGRGFLLRAFQRRGWEVQGTELSDHAAQYARLVLKLPIQTGSLETLNFPDGHFDAVVMWHVLEHVADPRAALAEVHRLLKPGGIFMVAVPNFASPEARWTRDRWFHLDVPRHLTHFTPQTLREALEGAGFDLCYSSPFAPEYDCFSFVQSVLNRLGLRHNLLYHLLRVRGAKVLQNGGVGWLQIAFTYLLAAPLGLLSLPATMLAGLLRQGATMTLYARRQS